MVAVGTLVTAVAEEAAVVPLLVSSSGGQAVPELAIGAAVAAGEAMRDSTGGAAG